MCALCKKEGKATTHRMTWRLNYIFDLLPFCFSGGLTHMVGWCPQELEIISSIFFNRYEYVHLLPFPNILGKKKKKRQAVLFSFRCCGGFDEKEKTP